MASRQRALEESDRSLFVSYSHGDEAHTSWVSSLVIDLRRAGYDVVFDRDENPPPQRPGEGASDQEILAYQLGELASGYLGAAQRFYGVAGNALLRASPGLPKNTEERLGEDWKRHIDSIAGVIRLAAACRNAVIVYTPRYAMECQPTGETGEAGWTLEELRIIVHSLSRSSHPKRVIVALRGDVEYPVTLWKCVFPFVDFSDDRARTSRLKMLLFMLSSERGPVDWSRVQDQTRERLQCLECDLAIPYPYPRPLVCLYCGTIRPRERLLCPRCDFNLSYPLDVPRKTAPGEIIEGPLIRKADVPVLTNRCPQCRRGKLLWYEA